MIREGVVDQRVLEIIIPSGRPLSDEDQYWDYKESFPQLGDSTSPEDRKIFDAKLCAVIKDIVAFYNISGGYLIAGVKDADRSATGWMGHVDCADLAKRIHGFTRTSIDIKYRSVEYCGSTFGLLYIPERQKSQDPVQFLKSAPEYLGRRAFSANDIYLRSRDECRKATSSDDFAILFSRDRVLPVAKASKTYLENNLPARDPSLLDFVGREEQIDSLWRWFTERYTAVKLLSGPGGVGKTSIAWIFCDAVSQYPPEGIEKIIWLTAKRKTYVAVLGEYVEIAHTHFNDLISLLRSILGELGYNDEEIESLETRDELIDETIVAITRWPCLLVVDDVDSLLPEEQFDVFRSVSTIFDRVIATGAGRARALLTARLTLGAAPGQLMTVGGMPLADFDEYVRSTASALGVAVTPGKNWENDVRRLHDASSGSPLFAASILRLVSLGESLSSAIRQYRGADGEEVRRFAFERELDRLTESQLRLLYASINLGDSTFHELLDVTQSNRTLLRDDIGSLRDYHLMALDASVEDLARGTSRVSVPAVITSMTDIIRNKISDPKRIETACARVRRAAKSQDTAAGRYIRQVIADWGNDDYERAVETAQIGAKNCADVADIWCVLGRSYLKRASKTDARSADIAFRKARDLGCARRELVPLWIEAKKKLGDWMGLVNLVRANDSTVVSGSELVALGEAYQALGDEQFRAGSYRAASEHYLQGAMAIRSAFEAGRAHGYVEPLKNLKYDLATAYANSVIRTIGRDDEKIELWSAVRQCVEIEVWHRGQISLATRALEEWWQAVKRRTKIDESSLRRAQTEARAAERLSQRLQEKGEAWSLIAEQMKAMSLRVKRPI